MYPQHYFSLFPPFPRESKVFVAMSFDDRFAQRYEKVIAPGIRQVLEKGVRLEPLRVDARRISDSVLTEILSGITNSVLVLADITSIGTLDGKVKGRVVRNDNVMYEIGLAHAIRLPEEVLIVRSDKKSLSFNLANVRVNPFDPDQDPEGSRQAIAELIVNSLREVDQQRSLAVKKAAHSLDNAGWMLLMELSGPNAILSPIPNSVLGVLAKTRREASIMRLLDVGAIQMKFTAVTAKQIAEDQSQPVEFMGELMKYELTAFGEAIFSYVAEKIIGTSPDIHQMLSKKFAERAKEKQM